LTGLLAVSSAPARSNTAPIKKKKSRNATEINAEFCVQFGVHVNLDDNCIAADTMASVNVILITS